MVHKNVSLTELIKEVVSTGNYLFNDLYAVEIDPTAWRKNQSGFFRIVNPYYPNVWAFVEYDIQEGSRGSLIHVTRKSIFTRDPTRITDIKDALKHYERNN